MRAREFLLLAALLGAIGILSYFAGDTKIMRLAFALSGSMVTGPIIQVLRRLRR